MDQVFESRCVDAVQHVPQAGPLTDATEGATASPANPKKEIKELFLKALEDGRWVPLRELQGLIRDELVPVAPTPSAAPAGGGREGEDGLRLRKKRQAVLTLMGLEDEGSVERRKGGNGVEEFRLAPEPAARVTVRLPVASLKAHPRQAELFSDLPGTAFRDLVADLRANGLNCPVEVLPDGTIVCGHQRVRAAKELGWAEIDAVVRQDLADAGEAAVAERLINDNFVRRQLGVVEVARCYEELRRIAERLPRGTKGDRYRGMDLRDRVAERFGMSGRNLDRLRRILGTPKAVQDAVGSGRLSLRAAGQVAGLKKEEQEQIAGRIAGGEDAEQVVAGHVVKKGGRHKDAYVARNAFFRTLERGLADLDGRLDEIKRLPPEDVEVIRRTQQVFDHLLQHAKVIDPAQAEVESLKRVQELTALGARERRAG